MIGSGYFLMRKSVLIVLFFIGTSAFGQNYYFEQDSLLRNLAIKKPVPNNQLFKGAWLSYQGRDYNSALRLLTNLNGVQAITTPYLEIIALTYARKNDWLLAKDYWLKSASNQILSWNNYNSSYKPIDKTSLYMSYIVPGSGLIYEGEIASGLISLSINGILIYSIINSFTQRKYGLSFLFLFLEIPFYKGNINALKEQIAKKTRSDTNQIRAQWLIKAESIIDLNYDF